MLAQEDDRRMRLSLTLLVIAMLGCLAAAPAHAQTRHAAPQAALDAALQEHVSAVDADREVVRRVLAHPAVQEQARALGLDLRQAAGAVATLGEGELAELASRAGQVEDALAGGQSRVTISTTAIIIGLLLLILIIVAVS
jgi:hypothetical protein